MASTRAQTPGVLKPRRTGWGPEVPQELQKVARELPPVGGKGSVPFAPLSWNMVPLVLMHQIVIARQVEPEPEPQSPGGKGGKGGKGKGKEGKPEPELEPESESDPDAPVSSIGVKRKRQAQPPSSSGATSAAGR